MNLTPEQLQTLAYLCFLLAGVILLSGAGQAWWEGRHARRHEKEVRRGLYAPEEEDV